MRKVPYSVGGPGAAGRDWDGYAIQRSGERPEDAVERSLKRKVRGDGLALWRLVFNVSDRTTMTYQGSVGKRVRGGGLRDTQDVWVFIRKEVSRAS